MAEKPSSSDLLTLVHANIVMAEGTGPLRHSRYFPYTDTHGKLTIGYGRNLTDLGLSQTTVDQMRQEDIDAALSDCQRFPWFAALTTSRQAALIELRFQLGQAGLLQFERFLAAMECSDYTLAGQELTSSLWAQQVPARASRLVRMIISG